MNRNLDQHGRLQAVDRREGGSGGLGKGMGGTLLAAASAALAGAAMVVRAKSKKAERENPPLGQFIDVDGVRLHYFERGKGDTVVLLHGNGVMAEDFKLSGVFDRLARQYRVIAIDRPGYGYSDRPRDTTWGPEAQARLLHAALLRLDVDQAVIVGHSWGTLVAAEMGLQFPDFTRALVLASGYYYPSFRMDVTVASQPAIPGIGDLMRFTVSPLIGRAIWPLVLKRLFAPAPVPDRFDAFPVWLALRPGQIRASAAESGMMIPVAMGLSKRYVELRMPVTILAGADDRHVNSQANSARLHQDIPQSELRMLPGIGHMLHYAVPDQVAEAVDSAAKAAAPVRALGMTAQPSGAVAPGALQ